MKKYIIILLFIFTKSYTQNNLKLNFYDVNNKIIEDVYVIIKNNNNKIVESLITNEYGFVTFNINKKYYSLTFTKLGFIEEEYLIKDIIDKKISKIILEESVEELDEVVVQSNRNITIKNDTIVFNADSFKQGNEQVLEDLLKKIPGLSVSDNGTIKVGNQEVEKVMIDGDDMFEKGYKILTKNMPVNPIDKIEIYQNYSNNKHLKGIENSTKVALNLTLKDDAKRIWFGNIQTGYGIVSKNIYEVRFNLMNFGKKNKYYFLTNLNNIGQNVTGDINNLIRSSDEDEPSRIGDNQTTNVLLGLSDEVPNLKLKRVNFNNTEMLSLNSIFTL